MELVVQREMLRKESLLIEQKIFANRVIVRRLKKKLGISTMEKDDISPEKMKRRLRKEDNK
jgi:enhancer of polycomb-like protein